MDSVADVINGNITVNKSEPTVEVQECTAVSKEVKPEIEPRTRHLIL